MPRRNHPEEGRRHQVGVFVREQDLREWRQQSRERNMSLSRWIYLRARRDRPVGDVQAMAGSLGTLQALNTSIGRVGLLLNQIARIAWADGFDAGRFSDAMAATQELQTLLRSARGFL